MGRGDGQDKPSQAALMLQFMLHGKAGNTSEMALYRTLRCAEMIAQLAR